MPTTPLGEKLKEDYEFNDEDGKYTLVIYTMTFDLIGDQLCQTCNSSHVTPITEVT